VSSEFSFTSRSLPGLHIVALHGELDLATANGLVEALVEIAGSTLVVDLADLSFMDSSGIGALVGARKRIRAKGLGELVVTRPTPIVREVLEIVGLAPWIEEWSPDWDDLSSQPPV
jgi:anti-sigma B factor antagonist